MGRKGKKGVKLRMVVFLMSGRRYAAEVRQKGQSI